MENINLNIDDNLSELSETELIECTGGSVASDVGYVAGFAIGIAVGGVFVLAALMAKKAIG